MWNQLQTQNSTEDFKEDDLLQEKKKMSEREATAGINTTGLGGAAGFATGKKTSGGLFLGGDPRLGDLIYKFGTKDQADTYLRTTEAMALLVGREYGRDMRNLVKLGKEKDFTRPRRPNKDAPQSSIEEYKTELTVFHKLKKEYDDNKSKVFVLILSQCSHVVKNKLENDKDMVGLEENDDVVGLLKKLKSWAFSAGDVENKYWVLQSLLRRLTSINQGPTETLTNYYKRFLAALEVLETQWGPVYPPGLVSDDDASKKAARDQMVSMIFLAGADKNRFEG